MYPQMSGTSSNPTVAFTSAVNRFSHNFIFTMSFTFDISSKQKYSASKYFSIILKDKMQDTGIPFEDHAFTFFERIQLPPVIYSPHHMQEINLMQQQKYSATWR